MHGPVPTHLKQPRNPLSIAPVSFDRHGFQGGLHQSRFHHDHVKPSLFHPLAQPLGQRSSFQTDRGDRKWQGADRAHQSFRLALRLQFFNNLPLRPQHTNRRACQRYIQSDKYIHVVALLFLGSEAHGNIRPRRRAAGASRATALHIMLTNKRNMSDSPTAPLRHLSLFRVKEVRPR